MAMLSYLQRYWSVGELRLKLDIAKQFGGVNESIMRIEDGVLRALESSVLWRLLSLALLIGLGNYPRTLLRLGLTHYSRD